MRLGRAQRAVADCHVERPEHTGVADPKALCEQRELVGVASRRAGTRVDNRLNWLSACMPLRAWMAPLRRLQAVRRPSPCERVQQRGQTGLEAHMTVLDPMHRLRTALESPMRPAPHRLTLVSAKDGSCMHAWLCTV